MLTEIRSKRVSRESKPYHLPQQRSSLLRPAVLAMLLAALITFVQDSTAVSPGISAFSHLPPLETKQATHGAATYGEQEAAKISKSRREKNDKNDDRQKESSKDSKDSKDAKQPDTTEVTTTTGTDTTYTTTTGAAVRGSCANFKAQCEDWVALGYCARGSSYRGFMALNCMLACTFCGATSTTVVTTTAGVTTRTSTSTYLNDAFRCGTTAECCPFQGVVCKVPDGCPSEEPHCWPRCVLLNGTVSSTFTHGCHDDLPLPAVTTPRRVNVVVQAVDLHPRYGPGLDTDYVLVSILMVGMTAICIGLIIRKSNVEVSEAAEHRAKGLAIRKRRDAESAFCKRLPLSPAASTPLMESRTLNPPPIKTPLRLTRQAAQAMARRV